MQTSLPEAYLATSAGQRAEQVLRSCVHCGFCNATCPTYQLLGDELDGPRGRIYLIKEMLEQQSVDNLTSGHLDRCLTCRSCETTCPSGVAYGELLEIGRDFQEARQRRPLAERFVRRWLLRVVPRPRSFAFWSSLGRLARPFLPGRLRRQLPQVVSRKLAPLPEVEAPVGTVLLLDGCVQRVATPSVNEALLKLLAGCNIRVLRAAEEGCCGGLALHLGEAEQARTAVAGNLDAVAGLLDEVDAVISTASGCGVTLKDYGRLLGEDAARADAARRLSDKVMDVGEYLHSLNVQWTAKASLARRGERPAVAVHVPCTLQHGQRRGDYPGLLLESAGFKLTKTRDGHLCCGSAGSYAILEPELSEQLGKNKVTALTVNEPDVIATGNVGCQMHLGGLADTPVLHWVELLAVAGAGAGAGPSESGELN